MMGFPFVAGLGLCLVIGVLLLIPAWQKAIQGNQPETFVYPMVMTLGLLIGLALLANGPQGKIHIVDLHSTVNGPRADFTQHAADTVAALMPQTKAALEAERADLAQRIIDLQQQLQAVKAAQAAESYNNFRDNLKGNPQ